VHIVKYAAYAAASVEATATAAAATAAAAAAEHPRTGALIENDQTERAAPLHRARLYFAGQRISGKPHKKNKITTQIRKISKKIITQMPQ
jgi:hypothetical protein